MLAKTPLSFGQDVRQLRTHSFQLLETRHPRGMTLAPHAHEHACVNFVLGGCYREDIGRRRCAIEPRQAAFKPAGTEHANYFEAAGARCLLVELAAGDAGELDFPLDDVVCTARPEVARAALLLWHELARSAASSDPRRKLRIDGRGRAQRRAPYARRAPRTARRRPSRGARAPTLNVLPMPLVLDAPLRGAILAGAKDVPSSTHSPKVSPGASSRGTTGKRRWLGRAASWWIVFVATRASLAVAGGSSVFRLRA
jgi:hypothetical protein